MTSSTLIKISILLFFTRLSPATFTKTYIRILWACIAFVAAYGIAFTILQTFNCNPVNAFWDQLSLEWIANPRPYTCTNEGVGVFVTGIVSIIQDFIAALLPTWLFWSLKIPKRQKIALAIVFLIGFITCVIGILRTYYITKVFWTTYDVSYYAYDAFLCLALECLMGAMCASAPPLKIFFKKMLQVRERTRTRDIGNDSLEHIAGQDSSQQTTKRRSLIPTWPKRASVYGRERAGATIVQSDNTAPPLINNDVEKPRMSATDREAVTHPANVGERQKTSWYSGNEEHGSGSSTPSFKN